MRAVRFDAYGDIDQLYVATDVPVPTAAAGEVVVRVRAAGLNPGETAVRTGRFHEMWPATFPSGQGSDFAGVVTEVAADVTGVAVGDEVLGWSERRSSQAEYVAVPATQVVPKPASVPFEVAGALYVAGGAAWAGIVATDPQPGETVVVSGAAGGVGIIDVQLVRERGARVIALASARNQEHLTSLGAEWVDYEPRETLRDRLREVAGEGGISAWIDTFGDGYVVDALELGVPVGRINTIIDFAAAAEHGVSTVGTSQVTDAAVLAGLAERVADGRLVVPIAATYPLEQVREAVRQLETRHVRGKVVLIP